MPTGRNNVAEMFLAQLGFQFRVEGDVVAGDLESVPELLVTGTLLPRVSVIATAADVLLGVLANAHSNGLPLTADLSTHLLAVPSSRHLSMSGALVKVGRSSTAGEARFVDDAGVLVAYACGTFRPSPRSTDLPVPASNGALFNQGPTISTPFFDLLGIHEHTTGVVEVARRSDLLQGTSTFQGGVVCAAGEFAAASLLGSTVTGLDTRYLSAIREGALRATAVALGPNTARVEVVDTGRPDRVAALMHCHAASLDA